MLYNSEKKSFKMKTNIPLPLARSFFPTLLCINTKNVKYDIQKQYDQYWWIT